MVLLSSGGASIFTNGVLDMKKNQRGLDIYSVVL